jgi:hypothetical protein
VAGAARARTLRHLCHAGWRGLVVLAGRLLHRPHRPAHRQCQILGRSGEVWLPESGTETLSVIRTAA